MAEDVALKLSIKPLTCSKVPFLLGPNPGVCMSIARQSTARGPIIEDISQFPRLVSRTICLLPKTTPLSDHLGLPACSSGNRGPPNISMGHQIARSVLQKHDSAVLLPLHPLAANAPVVFVSAVFHYLKRSPTGAEGGRSLLWRHSQSPPKHVTVSVVISIIQVFLS
ncbi:hypothetical protein LZ30DRAFT_121085 [Colletotrichum cereale]|nr:hypothetical protein LZ30DRAFT_121085 [Colletotrichum cereale]